MLCLPIQIRHIELRALRAMEGAYHRGLFSGAFSELPLNGGKQKLSPFTAVEIHVPCLG